MNDLEKRLNELAKLPPNWDSYGGLPIDQRAIDGARQVMRALSHPPQIVPTSHGGVQLEWHRDGLDIELVIGDDGLFHEWYVDESRAASPGSTAP